MHTIKALKFANELSIHVFHYVIAGYVTFAVEAVSINDTKINLHVHVTVLSYI
jgi:hypothetical protein